MSLSLFSVEGPVASKGIDDDLSAYIPGKNRTKRAK